MKNWYIFFIFTKNVLIKNTGSIYLFIYFFIASLKSRYFYMKYGDRKLFFKNTALIVF